MFDQNEKDILKWAQRIVFLFAGLIMLGTLVVDNTFEHGQFEKRGDTWYLISPN